MTSASPTSVPTMSTPNAQPLPLPAPCSPSPHRPAADEHQRTGPTSPLLRLPPELRTLIYAHLTPPQTLSYPLGPNTAISALSHRPPPLALLLASRQLAAEAADHFYRVARFRIALNPPAPLADPHFQRLGALPQLAKMRNLGVLLDWDLPRVPAYAAAAGAGGFEFGLEAEVPFFRQVMDRGRCADMLRLAKRLVGVLERARELRACAVSWTDLVEGCWEEKAAVLGVLERGLRARGVRVVKGEVVALDENGVGRLFEGWECAAEWER